MRRDRKMPCVPCCWRRMGMAYHSRRGKVGTGKPAAAAGGKWQGTVGQAERANLQAIGTCPLMPHTMGREARLPCQPGCAPVRASIGVFVPEEGSPQAHRFCYAGKEHENPKDERGTWPGLPNGEGRQRIRRGQSAQTRVLISCVQVSPTIARLLRSIRPSSSMWSVSHIPARALGPALEGPVRPPAPCHS